MRHPQIPKNNNEDSKPLKSDEGLNPETPKHSDLPENPRNNDKPRNLVGIAKCPKTVMSVLY